LSGGGINIADRDRVVLKINLCDLRAPDMRAVTHPILDGMAKKEEPAFSGQESWSEVSPFRGETLAQPFLKEARRTVRGFSSLFS
jgi:hypothetical protein